MGYDVRIIHVLLSRCHYFVSEDYIGVIINIISRYYNKKICVSTFRALRCSTFPRIGKCVRSS